MANFKDGETHIVLGWYEKDGIRGEWKCGYYTGAPEDFPGHDPDPITVTVTPTHWFDIPGAPLKA